MVVCSAKFLVHEVKFIVLQADDEIQLQAWKDLAISKQMLIRVATEALGLTEECSTEELQTALEQAMERTKAAGREYIKESMPHLATIDDDTDVTLSSQSRRNLLVQRYMLGFLSGIEAVDRAPQAPLEQAKAISQYLKAECPSEIDKLSRDDPDYKYKVLKLMVSAQLRPQKEKERREGSPLIRVPDATRPWLESK